MIMNKGSRFFTKDQIKKIFARYKTESSLSTEAYDIFCEEIHFLKKDIVRKVDKEIEFAFLRSNPTNMNPACYLPLSTLNINKKGVIFLSPFLFSVYYDTACRKIRCDESKILHEIAHHILGHTKQNNENEKEADELAKKWLREYENTIIETDI